MRPPKINKHKGRPVHSIKIIPHANEMDRREEQQMWYD